MSAIVDDVVQSLKAEGNQHFANKRYKEATGIYTSIIQEYSDKASAGVILTVRCNRAACHMELEEHTECENDCIEVIKGEEHVPTSVLRKAYYRLARALHARGKFDEALEALADLRSINPAFDPSEKALREEIECVKAKMERDQRIQNIPNEDYEETRRKVTGEANSGLQGASVPFQYEVHIGGDVIHFTDNVPVALTTPYSPEVPTKRFLAQLTIKYQKDLMRRKAWKCWDCPKPAVSMVHTPMSYLHKSPPLVVDFAQPVCENGGRCDKEARIFMADTMLEMTGRRQ